MGIIKEKIYICSNILHFLVLLLPKTVLKRIPVPTGLIPTHSVTWTPPYHTLMTGHLGLNQLISVNASLRWLTGLNLWTPMETTKLTDARWPKLAMVLTCSTKLQSQCTRMNSGAHTSTPSQSPKTLLTPGADTTEKFRNAEQPRM